MARPGYRKIHCATVPGMSYGASKAFDITVSIILGLSEAYSLYPRDAYVAAKDPGIERSTVPLSQVCRMRRPRALISLFLFSVFCSCSPFFNIITGLNTSVRLYDDVIRCRQGVKETYSHPQWRYCFLVLTFNYNGLIKD